MKPFPLIFTVLIITVLLLGCLGGGEETPECGNNACETGETQSTCCDDCGCPTGMGCVDNECVQSQQQPECGNSICESGETQSNCCNDCGCPTGQTCENNECWVAIGCGDGTCDSGETQSNCCDDCGCQTGYSCIDNVCVEEQEDECSDGTSYGQCSSTKPKYCSDGTLIDKCSTCGCPSGYTCENNVCTEETGGNGDLPDLVVSEISYSPQNPTTSTDLDTVTVKICNTGSAAAVPSGGSWSYQFLSVFYDGGYPDFCSYMDTVPFGTLNSGACEIVNADFTGTWCDITNTGTATIEAEVDPAGEYLENEVVESNENNNKKSVQVTVS